MAREHNWADSYTYQAARLHRPRSIDDVCRLVAGATKVHALGARHSFNGIADTTGDLIDLGDMPAAFAIDQEQRTVTVGAATRYGELARYLQARGLALHNLASLPHISIAGAIATGTHGSGDGNGGLATAVAALELVTADGDLITVRRGERGFDALAVGLGAFGVITRVTLEIRPSFVIRQDALAGLPWAELIARFDAVMAAAYSVSVFTTWSGDTVDRLWLKTRGADAAPARLVAAGLGAVPAAHARFRTVAADDRLTPFGIAGAWSEHLCHVRADCTDGPIELQSEYMLPRARATAALTCLRTIAEHIDRVLTISEIRSIAADQLWLSPCYGRDTVAIHFSWRPDRAAVDAITAGIEALLLPLGARPHWGKLMAARAAQIAPLYPRLAEFRGLADEYDPRGKFRNRFLIEHVFG